MHFFHLYVWSANCKDFSKVSQIKFRLWHEILPEIANMPLASPILVNLKPYQKYIKKHTECSFQYFSNQIWCITNFTRMPLQLWELNCENDFSFYVQLQRSQYLKVRVVCEPCGGPHISPTIRLALMDVQVLPELCNAIHIGAITQFVHCIPHFGQQS